MTRLWQMIPVGKESWKGMQEELLAGKVFDTGYRFENVTTTEDVHRTLLRDVEGGVTLALWQDSKFPCLQIYTPRTWLSSPSR